MSNTPADSPQPTHVIIPAAQAPSVRGTLNQRDLMHQAMDCLCAAAPFLLLFLTPVAAHIDTTSITGLVIAGVATTVLQILRRLATGVPEPPQPAPPA